MYKIVLTNQAAKDATKIEQSKLKSKTANLIRIIRDDPFQNPPPYEKLKGVTDTYSRRINIRHRLVYQVFENDKIIKIIRMWTHYE
jgi:Txe/YoeB family toxin of toxin-antitoxin system